MIPVDKLKVISSPMIDIQKEGYILPGRLKDRQKKISLLAYPGSPFEKYKGKAAGSTVAAAKLLSSKLVGILFCLPNSPLARNEIVQHLDYFHHRSGDNVDIFCIGYKSIEDEESERRKPVAYVNESAWVFSNKDFNESRQHFEKNSSWSFSGETDLILLNLLSTENGLYFLDFADAIACNLEEMDKDKAFTSVRAFFEQICKFGDKYAGNNFAFAFSDALFFKNAKGFIKKQILKILPTDVAALYSSSKHYVIRDISK